MCKINGFERVKNMVGSPVPFNGSDGLFSLMFDNKLGYSNYSGFEMSTDLGAYYLLVTNDVTKFDEYGYLSSTFNLDKFIGAEVFGVVIDDTPINKVCNPCSPDCSKTLGVKYMHVYTDRGDFQIGVYSEHDDDFEHGVFGVLRAPNGEPLISQFII